MPSAPLGTVFSGPNSEDFEITDFQGKGSFGEVYRAVGRVSGTIVAVKLLPVGVLPSEDSRRALLNEIRAAQLIRHPNVVEVLYVNDGTDSQLGPYFVMEYVSGGTLGRYLRTHEMSGSQVPLDRALETMIQIAQGARAINEKIIHRDIKPDNILVEASSFKIGDFGISKFMDESTRTYTFKGGQHIAYMAPEGWQQLPNTPKLDVYSVGIIFYEILALKHPLRDKVQDPANFLDWERAHLYESCPDVRSLRSETPLALSQLLSRMLSKRASDRPLWDEVLGILSKPESAGRPPNSSVAAAVEVAVARQQELEKAKLKAAVQQSEYEKRMGLYREACRLLLDEVQAMVDQFNENFQHGKITRSNGPNYVYSLPFGGRIEIAFFAPQTPGIKIRVGELIGGGWIGIANGRSANLLLLKTAPDDLYGHWQICEIDISALVTNRIAVASEVGLTQATVTPFGLKDAYFYEQMQHTFGMHVLTYNFVSRNCADYFAFLLDRALHSNGSES